MTTFTFIPNPRVEIVPFNSNWSSTFQLESNRIKNALGPNCVAIYHIGSTSIPGMAAKPIIDMLPVVRDILQLDTPFVLQNMEQLGYVARGELGLPFRRFFSKNDPADPTTRLFHVHAYEDKNPEIEHHLAYRNYLQGSPQVAGRYAQLKRRLAQEYPNDMGKYCKEKSKFIDEIGNDIKFSGVLLRECYTEKEWQEFNRLMQQSDYSAPANKDEFHFVLYKGISNIIGAAHLNKELEITDFKIDPQEQESSLEFNRLLALWKIHKSIPDLASTPPRPP